VPNLPLTLRSTFDIPRGGRIDGEDGLGGLFHGSNDGVKWRFDGEADTEAEDGVDNKVGGRQGGGEVFGEWNGEVFELCDEAGEELGGRLFRIVDRGGVPVVVKVAGADEAVAAWEDEVRLERRDRDAMEKELR
jgi:hypothetical protein